MESLSWSAAVAIIGSVGTAAATLLKIISMKSDNSKKIDPDELQKKIEAHDARCEDLKSRVAVLESEIANLHERLTNLDDDLDKLQDLFIKILSDKE